MTSVCVVGAFAYRKWEDLKRERERAREERLAYTQAHLFIICLESTRVQHTERRIQRSVVAGEGAEYFFHSGTDVEGENVGKHAERRQGRQAISCKGRESQASEKGSRTNEGRPRNPTIHGVLGKKSSSWTRWRFARGWKGALLRLSP